MDKLAIFGGKPLRALPFPQRTPYGEEELREVTEALQSQNLFYTANNKVVGLEKEFANKYNVKFAIACSSGTAAVHMAVAAIDATPGDEIIVPPVTDFGTIAGMLFQGLIPVFADWKTNTFTMDPAEIEKKITPRTKAIIVVHLFGNPCDMDAIMEIARRHQIAVIEDCCQAYSTLYKEKLVGTIADIACFSMQQSKHVATGEGGATLTNHEGYAMRMTLFRDKGWENRHKWGARSYSMLGLNYRMNELTGGVALAQLRKVDHVVEVMRELGNMLTGLIRNIPGILPAPVTAGAKHSYWLYPFAVQGYDARQFIDALQAEGIPVGWGYTVDPIYLCTDALMKKNTFGDTSYPFESRYTDTNIEYKDGLCPVAERELKMLGTLRIFESWTPQEIEEIAAAFHKVAAGLQGVTPV